MASSRAGRIPSLCRHKASGQAVIRLAGKDHYLGKFGSDEAAAAYDRLIAEWLSHGREAIPAQRALTVGELLLAYWRHAEQHYRHPDGSPTSEVAALRSALRPLRRLYGTVPAAEFGPRALKAVRQYLIEQSLARGVINKHISRIKRVFRWAVENELVPPAVLQGLAAVEGLKRNRSAARETEPIPPVSNEAIAAVLASVSPQIAALIRFQLLTGCRPGEACLLRPADLDRRGPVWVYRPQRHKLAYRDQSREIYIGPQAQALLAPWLARPEMEYCFSPREAEAERNAQRRSRRQSRRTPSQNKRQPAALPRRPPRDCYSVSSVRRAIERACRAAGIDPWHPHQLRHARAWEVVSISPPELPTFTIPSLRGTPPRAVLGAHFSSPPTQVVPGKASAAEFTSARPLGSASIPTACGIARPTRLPPCQMTSREFST